MPLIHDIKYDGSRYHTSYWSKIQRKRVFVGRFFSKGAAETERRKAIRDEL